MKRIYRFIFSRYFFSAVFITAELVIISLWLTGIWENSVYTLILGYIINALAVASLITKDTNPEYKIPWLLILITLPLIGTLLYVLFYSRPMRKKEARLLEELYSEINRDEAGLDHAFSSLKKESAKTAGKVLSILEDDAFARLYRHSDCKYLKSGEEYYEKLIEAILGAEKFIFLEYFIIGEGKMWTSILEILKEKAHLGVEVRVIYDDIGSMKTLPSDYEKELARYKISAVSFNKVSPSLSTTHNNRNHRKICIVDGKLAMTGGVNIADEYINERVRFGHWKDGGIIIYGAAVEGLLVQFLCDFCMAKAKKEELTPYLKTVKHLNLCDTGYYLPFASGPRPTYKNPVGKRAFLNIINQAEFYVYITTPYLVIDYELTEALRAAASRGVDVRIITPGIPDKKLVKLMAKSAYPYLLDGGVRIYEYLPGFIHEKLILADGEICVVGTINFDYRSLVHHFENAVFIYGSGEIDKMKEEFLKTLSLSKEDRKSVV